MTVALGANFTNKPHLRCLRVDGAEELQAVLAQIRMPYVIESIYHEPSGDLVCWVNPTMPINFINKKRGEKKP